MLILSPTIFLLFDDDRRQSQKRFSAEPGRGSSLGVCQGLSPATTIFSEEVPRLGYLKPIFRMSVIAKRESGMTKD